MAELTADTWKENRDRPAWVRENRDAIEEETDTEEPVPESLAAIADWVDRHKGTVTRQLNDDADGTDPHDEEERSDEGSKGEGEDS